MRDFLNRRDFLKQAGTAGAALSLSSLVGAPARTTAAEERPVPRQANPNDKLAVAVIGTNSRGLAHVECLGLQPGVDIAYICDVDDRAIAKGIKAASKHQQNVPKGLKDFRKALEDKSLDALTIATPDHWHAPMALLALAAGKHVYVEKPCGHNPYE